MIDLQHASMPCPHFSIDGKEEEKTVIVGPIRIFETERDEKQKSYDLVIGCNMFRGCENKLCAYSWVSRQQRKQLVEQVQP